MSTVRDLFLVDRQPNRNILKILNIYSQCHITEIIFLFVLQFIPNRTSVSDSAEG